MIFQTIDDKSECIGVYANGKLHFDNFPTDLTQTWKYTGSLSDKEVEYGWLVANGRTLNECCQSVIYRLRKRLKRTRNRG